MKPEVPIGTEELREGLHELLLDEVRSMEANLAPVAQRRPRMQSVRRHYARARAVADLLDVIDWTAGDGSSSCRLDVQRHGWAAATALQRVIARQYFAAWIQADRDEPEAAGEAEAQRRRAERHLALIQEVCREHEIEVAVPRGAS